jgi:hypothetical protein
MNHLRNSESLSVLEKKVDDAVASGDNSAASLLCCILWRTVNNLVITYKEKERIQEYIPV